MCWGERDGPMGFPENMTPNIYSSAQFLLGWGRKQKQNKKQKKEKLGEGKTKKTAVSCT
jgi:hypothetical protein